MVQKLTKAQSEDGYREVEKIALTHFCKGRGLGIMKLIELLPCAKQKKKRLTGDLQDRDQRLQTTT